tara:strand:- start:624 stop:755 length:132 start_codon:yes stop_codon:yes gene_type:complete
MLRIKTKCGIDKYKLLKKRNGILNKLRLYWYIFFAGLRDAFKK